MGAVLKISATTVLRVLLLVHCQPAAEKSEVITYKELKLQSPSVRFILYFLIFDAFVCFFKSCLCIPFKLGYLFIRGKFQPNGHNCANTNLIWFLHFVIACKTGKWWQHRAIWMELKQQLCVIWKSTKSFNFNPILACGILKSFKHLSNRKLLDGAIQLILQIWQMHFKGPK